MPRREEYSFMAASLMRQPFSEIILSMQPMASLFRLSFCSSFPSAGLRPQAA